MSDGMQTKPNELISAPASGSGDDVFAGLGLGDYVKKKDTGAIATGLLAAAESTGSSGSISGPPASAVTGGGLSLEEKRRLAMEADSMQKFKPASSGGGGLTPQVAPSQAKTSQPRDLTDTLMSQNLNQMRVSQSMSQFSSPSSTAPMAQSPSMSFGMQPQASSSTQWGNFSQAPSSSMARPSLQPQSKPDLSAFDSLLSMPSQQQKPSMNAMRPAQMGPVAAQRQTSPNPSGAKTLTASELSDFLN